MVEKVSLSEAHMLRRAFIKKFTTRAVPQYRAVMGHGDFYGSNGHKGLLWEIIRPYKILKRESALRILSQKSDLFVMWDYPLRKTSRELQKTRMLKIDGNDLAKRMDALGEDKSDLPFLPYDFYVFDSEMSFHLTFTTEYISGFGYICLTSLLDVEDDGISPAFREIFEYFEFGKA